MTAIESARELLAERAAAAGYIHPMPHAGLSWELLAAVLNEVDELTNPGDDLLIRRLTVAADDLKVLDPGGQLERDIRMATSRTRLAERAARFTAVARRQIRPVPNGGGTDG